MNQFSVYVPRLLPRDEYYLSGRRSCQGCGKALAARIASKTIGDAAVIAGPYLEERYPFTTSLTAHSYAHDDITYEPMLKKLQSALKMVNASIKSSSTRGHRAIRKAVVGIDRRIFLSNLLLISKAFENEGETLFLCFDNEPHIDKLIRQTSPQAFKLSEISHPFSASQVKKAIKEKNIPALVSESDFAYVATACPSFPADYMKKVKKGLECTGSAFISILSPCPTGWAFLPKLTVKVGSYAVKTGYYPLFEIEEGKVAVTQPLQTRKPVQDYLKMQKRFFTFPSEFIPVVQEAVDETYEELMKTACI